VNPNDLGVEEVDPFSDSNEERKSEEINLDRKL
jgi:hypothetical protein